MTTNPQPATAGAAGDEVVSHGIPAELIEQRILDLGVTHIVCVPDTHQRSLIARLTERTHPRLITMTTEDEAIAMTAGLYIGGARPMMLIQQTGLFASLNSVRGISLDAEVPTFMLVGLYLRNVKRTMEDNPTRGVRLVIPTLDGLGVPSYVMEGPADLDMIDRGYREAYERRGPVVVFVGAPTI